MKALHAGPANQRSVFAPVESEVFGHVRRASHVRGTQNETSSKREGRTAF